MIKISLLRDYENISGNGNYCLPTIISTSKNSDIHGREFFGPVMAVYSFKDEKEAISLANNTIYGLAAGLWTSSMEWAERVAGKLEAGTVWINEYRLFSAAAPRGGFKFIGIGREPGLEGILEYTLARHLFYGNNES
ncbi:MAG: aldehyde dehydrogenase family protein [Ferroplasma sp.]